jgi:biopolymer transport protein ExbB/TolQ
MNLEQEGFSIINAFLRFSELGAEWVMWLLLALGLVMIILFFERLVLFRKTKVDAPSMARQFVTALEANDFEQAKQVVTRGIAMEERVLADVLEVAPRGPQVAEQILQSGIVRERQRYERFLSYFGTIGNNAPFIGLLGTIIGIIVAFRELGANPKGGLEVVGPGIAEALVATAVGLLVAIPAVVAYNIFKGEVKTRVGNTDFLARIVMAWIQEHGAQSTGSSDAQTEGDN